MYIICINAKTIHDIESIVMSSCLPLITWDCLPSCARVRVCVGGWVVVLY